MGNIIAGLGEIGLDYSPKNQVEHGIQQRVFMAQLKVALKTQKPICLHIREADEDALAVLDQVWNTSPILLQGC